MTYTIRTEKFEGPLELLLELIERAELPITDVALAQVTDGYVQYLQSHQGEIDPRGVVDFLVVASRLLLLKSREILPLFHFEKDEDETGPTLAEQLLLYKTYWDAAKKMRKLMLAGNVSATREKPISVQEVRFVPPKDMSTDSLRELFATAIARLEPVVKIPQQIIRDTVTIQDRIERIRTSLADQVSLSFSSVIREAKNRTEIIVSFLAMLELMKQRIIVVTQDEHFADLTIGRGDRHDAEVVNEDSYVA